MNGHPSEVAVQGPKIVLTHEAIQKALRNVKDQDNDLPEDTDHLDLQGSTETFHVQAASGSGVRPPTEGEMYEDEGDDEIGRAHV